MTDHPAHDADDAMRPLVAGCLLAIVCVLIVCVVLWATAEPAGRPEAPPAGTTTTEQGT
jgi:hypothetical protein